jgi:hypothetical protein
VWPAWAGVSLAAAVALAVLFVALDRSPGPEFTASEEAVIGERLDLLRDYRVVERLDLLEDLELIGQLDRLAPMDDDDAGGEGKAG